MPPIQLGPLLPVSSVDRGRVRNATGGAAQTSTPAAASSGAVKSHTLDPGTPPVDVERVQLIRKAVETGTYPILPAKVADAMIAAGLLLRTTK